MVGDTNKAENLLKFDFQNDSKDGSSKEVIMSPHKYDSYAVRVHALISCNTCTVLS